MHARVNLRPLMYTLVKQGMQILSGSMRQPILKGSLLVPGF